MVDFAGWSMPVHYGSIVAEHQATRQALGLFDVSHMGRLHFSGRDAREFVDSLVTRRTADMTPGQVRYGLMTNDIGGILDDVLVYRVPEGVGEATLIDGGSTNYLMVVNASNRAKVLSWIEAKRSAWEKIDPVRSVYQAVLYRDYFCPDRTLATREDALRALRYGPPSPILR